MSTRIVVVVLASAILCATAAAQQPGAKEYLTEASQRHIDQRAGGLRSLQATLVCETLRGTGLGAKKGPASFGYEWLGKKEERFDLAKTPAEARKTTQSSLKNLWRELTGALMFDQFAEAGDLKLTRTEAQVEVSGNIPGTGPMRAIFETKHGRLVRLTPRKEFEIAYSFTRIGDRFRLHRREPRFHGKRLLRVTYGKFRPVNGYELPTRVTLDRGEPHEWKITYTKVNGKDAVTGKPDPATTKITVKAFEKAWKGWSEKERVAQIGLLSDLDDDLASRAIAKAGLVDRAWAVRQAAVVALGRMKRRNVTGVLCDTLNRSTGDKVMYKLVTRSLGQIGDPRAVKTLSGTRWRHKGAGMEGLMARITALGQIKHASAVDALLRYFVETSEVSIKLYRGHLISSLKSLTGQNLGNSYQAWRKWWSKSRATFEFKGS